MTTFVLKKYDETKQPEPAQADPEVKDPAQQEQAPGKPESKATVVINGSLAEIVANALNAELGFKPATGEEAADQQQHVTAISAEEINVDPVKALQSIQQGVKLYIASEGFNTKQQEWFLTNLSSKTTDVHYTLNSLVNSVKGV